MQLAMKDPNLQLFKTTSLSGTISSSSRATNHDETSNDLAASPSKFLQQHFPHIRRKRSRPVVTLAHPAREDDYKMEIVRAIRSNDVDSLRDLWEKGNSFDACNGNGESLLHLACRRGKLETVRFLLEECHVNTNVQDVLGRTVLHDVCWKPYPDLELMELLLLHASPTLLFTEDCRGHSCFDYARKEHWGKWIEFLQKHLPLIQKRLDIVSPKQQQES